MPDSSAMPLSALLSGDVPRNAALLLGFAVGLGVLARVMGRLKRATLGPSPVREGEAPAEPEAGFDRSDERPRANPLAVALRDGQSGLAVVEFALIFPIALMLLMLVVQTALMVQANLIVNYAAFCATRSAVVWIPRPMGNEQTDDGVNVSTSDGVNTMSSDTPASPKIHRIHCAAAYACWPISGTLSPETARNAGASVQFARPVTAAATSLMRQMPGGGRTFERYTVDEMYSKYVYSLLNTRIRVQAEAPRVYRAPRTFAPDDLLRVDVEHDFALRIPFAGRLLGYRKTTIGARNVPVPSDESLYVTTIRASARLSNEGRAEYPSGVQGR